MLDQSLNNFYIVGGLNKAFFLYCKYIFQIQHNDKCETTVQHVLQISLNILHKLHVIIHKFMAC